jgi:hypothetical protein
MARWWTLCTAFFTPGTALRGRAFSARAAQSVERDRHSVVERLSHRAGSSDGLDEDLRDACGCLVRWKGAEQFAALVASRTR